FSITMLKDAEGRIEGIAAILRDVSKRWNRERALKKRVEELEATQQG
ncbi:MAG: histidine kinase, partial [Corynebacterium marinum]|nr:histidine kinase [Corynebacterium marinum]